MHVHCRVVKPIWAEKTETANRVCDRASERDALIATTALVHRMTVVTRNVADFEPTKVPLFNPGRAETKGT